MLGDHNSNSGSSGGGFGYVSKVSIFLAILGVFGAHVLSRMAEKGELPSIALVYPEQSLKRLAKSAPAPQPGQSMTIVRSIGVDGTTTATIPSPNKAASPCGEGGR